MMKVASWNVNGIRASAQKGLLAWIEDFSPDILGLQEVKANADQIPEEFNQLGYHLTVAPAKKAGYSGVMLLSKTKPLEVKIGLGEPVFDDEGRTIIAEYPGFYVINGYFPNGQRDYSRVDYKLSFSEAVLQLAQKLRKKKNVFIMGDINTAHHEIDLANPKANQNTTGFLPHERQWLDRLLAHKWIDTYRHQHPNKTGAYSWWTYRSNCRERNIGWRIDYIYANEEMLPLLGKARIHQDILGSDHCPISIEVKA